MQKITLVILLLIGSQSFAISTWDKIKSAITGPVLLPGEPQVPHPTTGLADCLQLEQLVDLPQNDLDSRHLNNKKVSKILVSKDNSELYLLNGKEILRKYKIALGFNTLGHKFREGDGRTPEGLYKIDFKNSESAYHLSLHVDYPNKSDTLRSLKAGFKPGGAIMIHGLPNAEDKKSKIEKLHPEIDWTDGCIAVTNAEIEEIYLHIKVPTSIEICPRSE